MSYPAITTQLVKLSMHSGFESKTFYKARYIQKLDKGKTEHMNMKKDIPTYSTSTHIEPAI